MLWSYPAPPPRASEAPRGAMRHSAVHTLADPGERGAAVPMFAAKIATCRSPTYAVEMVKKTTKKAPSVPRQLRDCWYKQLTAFDGCSVSKHSIGSRIYGLICRRPYHVHGHEFSDSKTVVNLAFKSVDRTVEAAMIVEITRYYEYEEDRREITKLANFAAKMVRNRAACEVRISPDVFPTEIILKYGSVIDVQQPEQEDRIYEVFRKWCGIKIEKPK